MINESVILVTAPYLSVVRPSLGVSTLKSGLAALGISSRIDYLNMKFAATVGVDLCEYIAERTSTKNLVGEWTFGRALNGEVDTPEERSYVEWLRGYLGHERFMEVRQLRDLAVPFAEESAHDLAASGARIIGFSSSFQQTCASLAIARRLRELDPERVICFGGANCEGPMGRALLEAYPFIDYIFSGESDRTFPQAAAMILAGDLPTGDGVSVVARPRRRMGSQSTDASSDVSTSGALASPSLAVDGRAPEPGFISDMDALPIPDFADYFATLSTMEYRDRIDAGLLFETSRGCWWGAKKHCRFCGLNGTGMTYRVKSPARVLQEIETLHEQWGLTLFEAADNIMNMPHVESVFGALAEREHPYLFFYEIKSNMTSEQLERIARGGVSWVQPGIESLDDDILALMEKGVSLLQNARLLRACQEIGIRAVWNLLWGFPGERAAQYDRMAEVMRLLEHLDPPSGLSQVRLDRFSPYFEQSERLGFIDVRPAEAYRVVHSGVDPHLIADLAYFFDGTPTDVDEGDYIAPVRRACAQWRERADDREDAPMLLMIRIGPLAAVKDTRSCSLQRWRYIEADELRVLEAFNDPSGVDRSLVELQRATGKDHRPAFEAMVNYNYLLPDRGKALSLVVEAGRLTRNPALLDRYPGGSLRPPVDSIRAIIEADAPIVVGDKIERSHSRLTEKQ